MNDPLGQDVGVSRRKCLLFAVAVLRTDAALLECIARCFSDRRLDAELPKVIERFPWAIDVIERSADGRTSAEEEDDAREGLMILKEHAVMDQDFETAVYFRDIQNILLRDEPGVRPEFHTQAARVLRQATLAGNSALNVGQHDKGRQAVEKWQAVHACYLADVFGFLAQPVFAPEWRTSTATAIARQMYESRDFSAMPILADALQDAGCDSDDVLTHCRNPEQVHVRGCWVADLVLGKE